jgi:hypothetical protein
MKPSTRLLRRGLVVTLAGMLVVAPATAAIAAPAQSTQPTQSAQPAGCIAQGIAQASTPAEKQAANARRANMIGDAIGAMLQQGWSDRQIDRTLRAGYGVVSTTADVSGQTAVPQSVTNNLDLVLYDAIFVHDCTGEFYAYTHWHFNNVSKVYHDETGSCNGCNVGDYDGIGIAFSRAVKITSGSFVQTWCSSCTGNHYPRATRMAIWSGATAYGITFRGQDRANASYKAYSFENGEAFAILASCTSGAWASVTYAHTWSRSNELTSFSISPGSVTFNLASASYGWSKGTGASSGEC